VSPGEPPQEPEARQAAERDPGARDGGSLGFVLESALRARRIVDGRPTMVLELGNGATVIDGDRLQIHVRTSQDAHVYLAFCSQNAGNSKYPGLKVFPEAGAIYARAHETTVVPHRQAEVVLDDKPGQETMYLILSRVEISSSDSSLAQVIAAARQGSQSADCGTPFQAAVAGARAESKPTGVWSGKLRSVESGRAAPEVGSGVRKPRRGGKEKGSQEKASEEVEPVVEIQRGGDIVWNNGVSMGVAPDPDGIVVLRYRLTHVAR
jgi:hypothetical protein